VKNIESEIILILYRWVVLIGWHERIIGVFKGGVNFIINATVLMKQEAIYELQKNNYLSKELADFLLNKLCYRDIKKARATSKGRTGYLHIHLEKYKGKVIVFQNNYSRILGVFQNGNLDLMDEDGIALNTRKKIIEQLKYYGYINKIQMNSLIKEYCQN